VGEIDGVRQTEPLLGMDEYIEVFWVFKDADRAVGVVGSVFQAFTNSGFNHFAASSGTFKDIITKNFDCH
jgi:hypothetical protein